MPSTEVRAFRDSNGSVPLQAWLDDLEVSKPTAYKKCLARITELADKGNQLRRPLADYLRDGIYELRATVSRVHYRILYFFTGSHVAILSHGTTKEVAVDNKDIELAIRRMALVKSNPKKHTADIEIEE